MARTDRSAHVEAPRPALEAGNAISLMTVHRSKGLEWPVVVMADLCRKRPVEMTAPLCSTQSTAAALKADGVDPADQPMLFRFLRHKTAVREQHEEKRLLYVAATRARDYLLLASTRTGSEGSRLNS